MAADRTMKVYQETRRYIELFKRFCQDILAHQPRVYRHTPHIGLFRPADWCVLEYAAPDRTRGYAGVFSISRRAHAAGGAEYLFRPRGLNRALDYEVTFDNQQERVRISGRDLAITGLPIRLDSAMTSELLLFQACSTP